MTLPFLFRPSSAHSLETCKSFSRTRKAAGVMRLLEEGVSKTPARGIPLRRTYEATMSGRRGKKTQSLTVFRKSWEYMRRVYEAKVGAFHE